MSKIILYVGLFILLLVTVSAQQFINPGVCYTRTFDVWDNATNTTTAQNFTVCANNATQSFVNISLDPGEQVTELNNTCQYDFLCSLNETPNKCIIDGIKLDPGEDYTKNSQTCQVDIEVDECEASQDDEVIETTKTEQYRIYFSNQSKRIQFEFGGEERIWNIDDNIDISGTIDYQCPVSVVNASSGGQVTAEQCKALSQVYCGDAFDIITQKFDTCEDRKTEYESKLENMRQSQAQENQNQVCMTKQEYLTTISELNTSKESAIQESEQVGMLKSENRDLRDGRTALGLAALFFMSTTIVAYFKWKPRGKQSAMGGG